MTSIVDLAVDEQDGVPVVRLAGEIDMSVTASVAENLNGVPREGAPGVVVDLTELEYLDSAGLRLLIQLSRRVTERGQSLRLVVAEDSLVGNLLAVTRTDGIVPVHATVPEALAGLGVTTE